MLIVDGNVSHQPLQLMIAVAEGYKTKQTIFPELATQSVAAVATDIVDRRSSALKRSREGNEEEDYNSVPSLVVTSSFNSLTSEEDWDEPDWLLPKEVVCTDVEMKETS
jgi:hypothetical protein